MEGAGFLGGAVGAFGGAAGAFGGAQFAPHQHQHQRQHHHHHHQQQQQRAFDAQQRQLQAAPGPLAYAQGLRQPHAQQFGLPAPVPAAPFAAGGPGEVGKAREHEDEDGYRSECWSGSTASESSSDYSPPPSAGALGAARAGGSDWDLLSEMLLDDALESATASGPPPPPPFAARAQYLPYQPQSVHRQQFAAVAGWPQQQVADYRQERFRQFGAPAEPPAFVNAHATGISADARGTRTPLAVANARQTKTPPPSSSQRATGQHSSPSTSSSSSASGSPASAAASSTTATPPASSALSAEEMKKLRRRTQIASSVQRHREKKKCVVSALKTELSGLTTQLEELRAQRKAMHADARLVEWEEAAVTQRRKRKQTEERNAQLKKALFQQTAFLMGMRGLLRGGEDALGPSEMEFHDWIHSFTILSARGQESRRRELLGHFSESRMDLAKKLVLRETDPIMPSLGCLMPYYAKTRVLHDGTQQFVSDPDHDAFVVKREIDALRAGRAELDAGDGRVLKKFTSVFLFQETAAVTLERLHALVFESSKGVGVYWPADGYTTRVFDHAPVPTSSRACSSNVFYADMAASMSVMDDLVVPSPEASGGGGAGGGGEELRDIFVEARVLCREARDEHEGVIVWDYVDRDDGDRAEPELTRRQRTIRRNCCGAVVTKREPGGMLSVRSISVKMFAPDAQPPHVAAASSEALQDEQLRALFRRIGLQATEVERSKEKCTRFVYNALQSALS